MRIKTLSCLLLFSFFSQISVYSFADPARVVKPFIVHPKDFRKYDESAIYVLPDKDKIFNSHEVLMSWENGEFVPLNEYKKPGKFQRGSYVFWLYFHLKNLGSDSLFLACEVARDFVWINGIGHPDTTIFPTKDHFGILNNPIAEAFYHVVPPGKTDTILVKVAYYNLHEDFGPYISDLTVFDQKFLQNKDRLILIYGLSCGLLLILIFSAFFLFLQNRDKAFLWYTVYLFIVLFIAWRNLELLYPPFFSSLYVFPWRNSKFFQNVVLFIAYVQFVRYFIDVKSQDKKLDKILVTFNRVFLIALPVEIFLQTINMHWSYVFYWWFRAGGVLFCFLLLFWLIRLKSPMIKFVIAGSLSLIIWDIISWMFPANITSDVTLIGVLFDVLCFSAGLAYREKLLRDNHDRLQKNLILEMQKSQQLQLEKEHTLIQERDRIAAEMHDDLGSGLTTLRFLSLAAIENEADVGKKNRITKIAEKASDIMQNIGDIIWAMNSKNDSLDNFCYYMRGYAADFLEDNKIKSRISMPEVIPGYKLEGSKRRNLLLVVKEVLNNIAKHSKGSEVAISVHFENQLRIEIRDNGVGFSEFPGLSKINGGNGLKNITKRIQDIGGTVQFIQNNGTEVRITTPFQN